MEYCPTITEEGQFQTRKLWYMFRIYSELTSVITCYYYNTISVNTCQQKRGEMTNKKMTGIRLDDTTSYKIRYIAEKQHRKLNDEMRMIIENHIKAYEEEYGEIEPNKSSGGGVKLTRKHAFARSSLNQKRGQRHRKPLFKKRFCGFQALAVPLEL